MFFKETQDFSLECVTDTAKNTVISPNFLVWKFCGIKFCGNCSFLQNFHTRKLGEITVFFAVRRGDFQSGRRLQILIFPSTSTWNSIHYYPILKIKMEKFLRHHHTTYVQSKQTFKFNVFVSALRCHKYWSNYCPLLFFCMNCICCFLILTEVYDLFYFKRFVSILLIFLTTTKREYLNNLRSLCYGFKSLISSKFKR